MAGGPGPGTAVNPNQTFVFGEAEETFIRHVSSQLHLDPNAVLAVASHEGVTLPSEIGDYNTSFGPWQMHYGGAYPASAPHSSPEAANAWANSPAGITYALQGIAHVAAGETGPQAIHDIVYGFERPHDPASETAASIATYQQGGKPRYVGGNAITPGSVAHSAGSAIGGAIDSALSPVEKALIRGAMIVGGFALAVIGLYLLARALGAPTPALPGPLGAVAGAAPRQSKAAAQESSDAALGKRVRREDSRIARKQAREHAATENARQKGLAEFGEVPF